MADDRRLGRGLGAIFGDDVTDVLEDIQQNTEAHEGVQTKLDVDSIRVNPYQPRRHFDEGKLEELARSIQQHGLFTPILVRETSQGYELVAGERRLRASRLAGLETITAIVVDFNDRQMMEIALIENVQREDLNVIEEAMGYASLIERLDLTQEEVAKRVSKSRSHISNLLRLLRLPETVKEMLAEEKLSMGQVRPLVGLEAGDAISIAQKAYREKMSARDVEDLVRNLENPETKVKPKPEEDLSDYRYAVQLFEERLQTRTEIKNKKITIHFADDEDLNRILDALEMIE